MKYLKLYKESVLSNLNSKEGSREYKFLGKTNSPEWQDNIEEILNNYKSLPMLESDKSDISEMFEKKTARTNDRMNPVEYPPLTKTQNSRFSYCWFLGNIDVETDYGGRGMEWDICIQYFEGEYFLVNIGSGEGWFNYWYWCDQFGGLQRLIKDKLLK